MCLSLSTTPEVADAKIDIANSPISYSDDAEGTQSSIFWPEHPNQVPLDLDYKDDYYDSSQNADYSDFFRPSLMSESPQLNLETEGSYPFNDGDDYDYSDDGVTEVNIASILRTPISSLPTVASFELRWRLRYNPAARNIKPWQRAFPDLFDVRLDEENLLTYNAERIDQWRKDNSSYFIACTVMYFSEALMHIQVVVPKVKQDSTTIEITLHNRSDRELLFNCR
ncbi:hypothetical protein BDF19DRAFT_410532 [Syncephalis fuscata]|nr:hypothetical protein BDF19DRAFT_410532 [Syncephalis fuscata]